MERKVLTRLFSKTRTNDPVPTFLNSQTTGSPGIISRQWPYKVRHYWFGQCPIRTAMPDIAMFHSIPAPLEGANNVESWTIITDLSGSESDLMYRLSKETRKQVRRAEREGITVERLNCMDPRVIDDFTHFWNQFSESKEDVRDILTVSVQLKGLYQLAKTSMLEISRSLGPDGKPIVYHVLIVVDRRACVQHSASLFRESQSSIQRHFLGWANRYLHWRNMLYYKQKGYAQYDMGGWYAGKDNESLLRINQFKKEFGGKVVCEYDATVACTTLGGWMLPLKDWLRERFR